MQKGMKRNHLLQAVNACVENGHRLHEDAEVLGTERSATAVALCILAQEEFAKAFLLHLVCKEIIPWTAKVRKSLYRHEYKHLVGIIMEWLRPPEDECMNRLGVGLEHSILPAHVVDAMKIYVEKNLPKGHISCPPVAKDPIAMTVAEGDRDKIKQDALYVRLSEDGEVLSIPTLLTTELVEAELERTKRLSELVGPLREGTLYPVLDYDLFVKTMNFLLLDKGNRPFLLLRDSKFGGPVTSLNGTTWLHSITVLIENISAEEATVDCVDEGLTLDEELVEPFFRINQFLVDPHTTMICTFGVSEETFACRTSSSHKRVLYVNLRYHGILSASNYRVCMWSRYDARAGIFRETLTDSQELVNGESKSSVETKIWWNRPTSG